jgi:hypothetical protein
MAALALLVVALAVALVAIVVLLAQVVRHRPAATIDAVLEHARRHEALISTCAAVAAVSVVVMVWQVDLGIPRDLDEVARFTSPFLGALVLCVARGVGERFWPRPTGSVRRAPLARRTVVGVAGRRLPVLAATVALGVVAVVVYGVTGTAGGRAVAHEPVLGPDGTVVEWGQSGPYPGWAFGIPIGLALALVLAATVVALRAIARRPALAVVPAEQDDAVRRTSAARLLAGVQAWTGGALALMMLAATVALLSAGHPVAAASSAVVGLATGLGSLVVAVTALPARQVAARPLPETVGGGA